MDKHQYIDNKKVAPTLRQITVGAKSYTDLISQ